MSECNDRATETHCIDRNGCIDPVKSLLRGRVQPFDYQRLEHFEVNLQRFTADNISFRPNGLSLPTWDKRLQTSRHVLERHRKAAGRLPPASQLALLTYRAYSLVEQG